MFPLRLSLFALIFLAVLGMSQEVEAELVSIECPGCDAQMKVPKLNELQEVTCSACGLSGEIEI